MGLQKPSNHVMAGKATIQLVYCEDVEASTATDIDGDDEHIVPGDGGEAHHFVSGVEGHIAVHITVSL